MNRIVAGLSAVALSAALAACGSQDQAAGGGEASAAGGAPAGSPAAAAPAVAAAAQPAAGTIASENANSIDPGPPGVTVREIAESGSYHAPPDLKAKVDAARAAGKKPIPAENAAPGGGEQQAPVQQ